MASRNNASNYILINIIMADNPADQPTDKPADKPVDKPTDKPADKPADKVTLSKEEHDNITKARDSEREARKKAEDELAELKAEKEEAEKKKKQADSEAKGEYDKIIAEKDEEIKKLQSSHDRLTTLEEKAKAKNEEDLKLFEDEDQKSLVDSAIEGKSPLEARDIIKKFKKQFLDTKDDKKGDFGGKNKGNADDKELKLGKIENLSKEFDELLKKQKAGALLNAKDKKRLFEIPKELKELRKEDDK